MATYRITKASYYNTDDEKAKYEKLGFKFRLSIHSTMREHAWEDVTSVPIFMEIEDLRAFVDEWGPVVIEPCIRGGYTIVIYDDYLE